MTRKPPSRSGHLLPVTLVALVLVGSSLALDTVTSPPAGAAVGDLTVEAGYGPSGFLGDCVDGPLDTTIELPEAVDVAGDGTVAASTPSTHRVVGLVDGKVRNLAGTGAVGPANAADGGPAAVTAINDPAGLAYDAAGNLFVVEQGRNRVRRIDAATGIITTVAGSASGTPGYTGDGGSATLATLSSPSGIAVDSAGSLYIIDAETRVRRVAAGTGTITTVVSGLTALRGIAVSPNGNDVYLSSSHQVLLHDRGAGATKTVAGDVAAGFAGDGGPAEDALLNQPRGLDLDSAGHLFVADTANHRIRRIDATTGTITTVAGSGTEGFSEGNGPPTNYHLDRPFDVAFDPGGDLHLADFENQRIRHIDTGRLLTLIGAGTGTERGICALAEHALFSDLGGIAVAPDGDLLVADAANRRVRRIDSHTDEVSTVAGSGSSAFSGDGGPATEAGLGTPADIVFDRDGHLYIADQTHHRVRRVDALTGVITTVAGTGSPTQAGDGGAATAAPVGSPSDLAFDPTGGLIINTLNNLRRVDPDGTIDTLAGNGGSVFSGDGGLATDAGIGPVTDVVVDDSGAVFLAQASAHRVRRIDPATQIIDTVVGAGVNGTGGDGGPAEDAQIGTTAVLAVDSAGNLYIGDEVHDRIRRVDATTGIIDAYAGDGSSGSDSDEGPATSVGIGSPSGLAVSPAGDLVFTTDDSLNQRVRRVEGDLPVGYLRATTTPAVPATITVDGVPRDSWGLTWLEVPTGMHEVCFGAVAGFTPPPCQDVLVSPGQTTVVDGAYTARGYLRVTTTPAVPATIFVEDVPRNDWGVWTEVDPGSYKVCFGQVADFTPPPCQTVDVDAGATTLVDGAYTASPGAPGPSGHGFLRATTSPATGSRVTIDGEFADSWGLTWLKLPPDFYDVCFEDVLYATAPVCEEVKVIEGETAVADGAFTPHGFLQVSTSPAVPATIYVDGRRANAWGVYTSLEPGSHTVCYGALPDPGLAPPPCEVVTVTAGATTSVVGTYT